MIKINNSFKVFIICHLVLLQISGAFSIKGGRPADIKDVPSVVQVYVDGNFRCAGNLVSNRTVVTAAHCVQNLNPKQLTVKAGTSKLIDAGIISSVRGKFVYGRYDPITLDMDVAVLKLKNPIQDESVKPATLCSEVVKQGDTLQVYGWGKSKGNNNEYHPNQLHTVELKVVANSTCGNMYRDYRNLTETMFCAATPVKGAGSSDSGSPAIRNGELCGIVSWAVGYGEPGYPSVYTDVSSPIVHQFIRKVMLL